MKILNLIGLVFVTFGALLAMASVPAPSYGKDGSVSLGPLNPDGSPMSTEQKIWKYKLQRFAVPGAFRMIAFGSALQFVAAYSDL